MNDFLEDIVFPILIVIFLVSLIMGLVIGEITPFAWFTAKNEAFLYNKKYNTQYTTSQFFWAGETIKSFLNEGKQTTQNLNINGAIPVSITK